MSRFIKRTSSHSKKSTVVGRASPTTPFGYVGTNCIRGSDHLFADRSLSNPRPTHNDIPDQIGKSFSQLINIKLFEVGLFKHYSAVSRWSTNFYANAGSVR